MTMADDLERVWKLRADSRYHTGMKTFEEKKVKVVVLGKRCDDTYL